MVRLWSWYLGSLLILCSVIGVRLLGTIPKNAVRFGWETGRSFRVHAEGQAFFCIPDRPALNNAKERANTAIVTILKGTVTAKQLEEEFTRILSGSWRWTARRVAGNKYIVRLPDVQLIKEWGKFNPVKMRTAKAKIQIDTWNGSIGAKAELQMAWFRVRGIPYDKRSKETAAYAGSLVGATADVDKSSLNRTDYVRVKIAARDVSKVPAIAEGAILPYLYDFHYEREVEMGMAIPANTIQVPNTKEDECPKSKKAKTDDQLQKMKEVMSSSSHMGDESSSAHPKVSERMSDVRPQKLMADAQKSYYKKDEASKEDMGTYISAEDRVQGLSGDHIQDEEEEDDLNSDDIQGECHAKLCNSQIFESGLVKCSARERRDGDGGLPQNKLVTIMENCEVSKGTSEIVQEGAMGAMGGEIKILGEVDKDISELQLIPETRHSERIQNQLVKNIQRTMEASKKRTLEGMEVPTNNSFSVLSNDTISVLAADMGVKISLDNFDTVDIMKDLEMARLALDKAKCVKCVKPPVPVIEECHIDEVEVNEGPLLEWLDDDSEAE
jgi:hypothetical protein